MIISPCHPRWVTHAGCDSSVNCPMQVSATLIALCVARVSGARLQRAQHPPPADRTLAPCVPLSPALEPSAARCLPRRSQPETCSSRIHVRAQWHGRAQWRTSRNAQLHSYSEPPCIAHLSFLCSQMLFRNSCATPLHHSVCLSPMPGVL